jgi:O-antigen/teichoic acid export membrane protein
MIKYGVGYIISTSLVQSRSLVLLSIVGRLMGQEAVGYMGLTLRAVGLAAPFRAAVSRVILPAIAPIAHIPETLKERINATVEMELLLSIPVIVFAVAIYPFAVRLMLGPSWQPTATLFPWVAAGSLLAAAHATSLNVLNARGFFAESIASTIIGFIALALSLAILGRSMGIEGCAIATMVVWPASWTNEWFSHRRLGTRWSTNGVLWAVGGASTCLAWRFGPWVLLLPVAICIATYTPIRSRTKVVVDAFF